jgi:hypothetical protein
MALERDLPAGMQAVSLNGKGILPCHHRAFSPRCYAKPLPPCASSGNRKELTPALNGPQQAILAAMMMAVATVFPMDAEAKKTEPPPPPPTAFDVRPDLPWCHEEERTMRQASFGIASLTPRSSVGTPTDRIWALWVDISHGELQEESGCSCHK